MEERAKGVPEGKKTRNNSGKGGVDEEGPKKKKGRNFGRGERETKLP